VEQVTPAMSEKNNLPIDEGIFIRAVDPGSPGERARIQPGDVLIQIGLDPRKE
jgi:S1-C subfamily serine protease